jgi:adenosylhomocysteine nucleosidase
MNLVNRENRPICLVFPMGMEMAPFMRRVEVKSRWTRGKATYRIVYFEGRLLLTVRCGIGPVRAAAAIKTLEIEPSAVIAAGAAGSLVEDAYIGGLVVATETVWADGVDSPLPCDPSIVARLARACEAEATPARSCRVVTADRAVFAPESRRRLHRDSSAHAVDMESHAIALEARKLGVPFSALRVLSDDMRSPELPERIRKIGRNNLAGISRHLAALWRWSRFIRDFRRVVELLPPILIRFVRETPR